MRLTSILSSLLVFGAFVSHRTEALPAAKASAKGFYALQATDIDGKRVSLSQYAGKVALVVNTASMCGFTPQYEGLEALYQKYKDQGFVILGFPSNDFGSQEPGSNEEIKKFCEKSYRITFPLFAKDKVTGADKQPIYKFLTEAKGAGEEVDWNFEKFLIDPKGAVVGRFKSRVKPSADELDKQIQALLTPAEKHLPKKS